MEKAVFGGGCFWCTEAIFQSLKGVDSVEPGYVGGTTANPTYENIGDHVEAIQIEYNPKKVSYQDLLTVFFVAFQYFHSLRYPPKSTNRCADVGQLLTRHKPVLAIIYFLAWVWIGLASLKYFGTIKRPRGRYAGRTLRVGQFLNLTYGHSYWRAYRAIANTTAINIYMFTHSYLPLIVVFQHHQIH